MIKVAVNKEKWDQKYRAILSKRVYARRLATIAAARAVVQHAYAHAPVDTGRFKKNLAQAANAAGVGPFPVIRTKRSRYAEKYLDRLVEEVSYWTKLDEQYQRENRTSYKYYAKILKRRAKAELELKRFEQTNDAVVIGGLWGNKTPTVRYKNYTGQGRIRQTRDQTLVTIHNTEAHANFVERRTKVMWNAIRAAKAGGGAIKKLSKKGVIAALAQD